MFFNLLYVQRMQYLLLGSVSLLFHFIHLPCENHLLDPCSNMIGSLFSIICVYVHVCTYLGGKFNTFYPYVRFLSYRADGFSVFDVGFISISFLIRAYQCNLESLEACLLRAIGYLLI